MVRYRPPAFEDLSAEACDMTKAPSKEVTKTLLDDPGLMSAVDLAKKLGVHESTVRRWIDLGAKNRYTGRRVKLEAIWGTGKWESSMAAYRRMKERINAVEE